ncbi:MAG: radical SAM protein [Treponema sp.]|nr:radical SAM protein [Treponema sp.]
MKPDSKASAEASASPEAVLIQPPLVQLNGPYPAPYYLAAFLRNRGVTVRVLDHSIGLFERIFCRAGLERIFADAEKVLGDGDEMARAPARATAQRFLSESDRWVNCIDRLVNFLRGRDREWGHFLALANGTLPGGPRFDRCLESLGGNPLPEDAPLLASKLLADMADFITQVLDRGFSLGKYAASLHGAGLPARDFAQVRAALDGYVLQSFYGPFLEEEWTRLKNAPGGTPVPSGEAGGIILGLSIPFPGCLAGALCCAASAKRHFGDRVTVIAGGGYVNTELRCLSDPLIFEYFDYLSFDRGYGALDAILKKTEKVPGIFYKTMYRCSINGQIIADPGISGQNSDSTGDSGSAAQSRGQEIDDAAAVSVFPDYRDLDFSRYINPVDDLNPMHRLWTDGRWLKAYLAHGCYWQNCSFCDVTLDYIRSYKKVEVEALYQHLLKQAELTGVHGVHLVDEAAPPASLIRLALLNLDTTLNFWGNIRFEKAFSPDAAALLAAGGLVGVSGGIEVATEAGFRRIGKGITLGGTVSCCAAFKEAGILTHAYLIYGYWDQDEQEIIDSAEILRQFFAAGLLDSAFWHRFVLTRHSKIFAECPPGLRVKPSLPATGFALNDLSFEGEERFDKYDQGLDSLLAAWMAGDTDSPVTGCFPFKVKQPGVAGDLIANLIDEYARERDRSRDAAPQLRPQPAPPSSQALIFLGSRPLLWDTGTGLRWYWRLEEHTLHLTHTAEAVAALLEKYRGHTGNAQDFYGQLGELLGADAPRAWKILRAGGLVVF